MSRLLSAVVCCALSVACASVETSLSGGAHEPTKVEEAFPGMPVEGQGVHHVQLDDGSTLSIPYLVQDGMAVAEGDILLGPANELGQRGATAQWSGSRWDCTIPYAISNIADPVAEQDFRAAIAHWEAKTDLRFVEDPQAEDLIVLVSGTGCSSHLGRVGGAQWLSLASDCGYGAAIHEIGHAVGLFHEQARADRDDHVRVQWQNVPASMADNFQSYVNEGLSGADVGPYDYGSIMHYASHAFSSGVCYPGETQGCTLTHLDGSYLIENQRHTLSAGDVAAVAAMYPSCSGQTDPLQPTVPDDHGDGFSDATRLTGSLVLDAFLDPGDRDVFELDVPPDSEVVAWTTGSTDTVGVVYFDGIYAGEDDTSGEGPNFALVTSASDSLLHLEVRGWTAYSSGPYTLHVEVTEPVVEEEEEEEESTVPTLEVAAGDSFTWTSELVPGAPDTFRVEVSEAGTLWVQTSDGVDLWGTVTDPWGGLLAEDAPVGSGGVVMGLEVVPGSYDVVLGGEPGASTGLYAVSVTLQ